MTPSSSGEELATRYIVGIDLGTTNSAVCFIDTERDAERIETFLVPQLTMPGQVEPLETLPSFHLQPAAGVATDSSMRLPWQRRPAPYVVGVMARDEGALQPGRQIGSAKSWLSHAAVDRTAAILPWHGDADVQRLSPIEVSARYLQHIREAWDWAHPNDRLADQEIVLTLPASFDEVARELTIQAATQAGLPRVVLIEEPQAAFYAWVDRHRQDWHKLVTAGQKILVCDVGGGTSDFTLIRVRAPEGKREIQFHRVAVGEHLILGGDNLDLAVARHLESKLGEPGQLPPRPWDVLVRQCRVAKETLLGEDAAEELTIHLPGSGARLLGGGRQVKISRVEAERIVLDGFFPLTPLAEPPRSQGSGLQEFGLPYASDPAVTRHLAAFLTAHRQSDADWTPAVDHDPARPDLVLFNGGVFESTKIRSRLLTVISDWFSPSGTDRWEPRVLQNARLDLAVARGAAYYGMVRRGHGVRIAAGLARSYYLGVASPATGGAMKAVCVVPGNAQPGEMFRLTDLPMRLRVSQPVEFPLFTSSVRLIDRPGKLVSIDPEQLRPLAPLRTVLRRQRSRRLESVPVHLQAQLTEIGTVELSCVQVEGPGNWRLQFDVRAATETDRQATVTSGEQQGVLDEQAWLQCEAALRETFQPDGTLPPRALLGNLVTAIGQPKEQWPMSLLRRTWETLMELQHEGRARSPQHEARWLNLIGFALRPGYGMAMDDWRVTETWRQVQGKLVHQTAHIRTESWILWRRLAGGLSAGQQQSLAEPLLGAVRALHQRTTTGSSKGEVHFQVTDFAEIWRLLAALEWLPVPLKRELGDQLIDLLPKRKLLPVRDAMVWAIGRLGSRVPTCGPLNSVLDAQVVERWLDPLMGLDPGLAGLPLSLMQLARRTHDRYRDLSESDRARVARWLERDARASHLAQLVSKGGELDSVEQASVFGEALPPGLSLHA